MKKFYACIDSQSFEPVYLINIMPFVIGAFYTKFEVFFALRKRIMFYDNLKIVLT